MLIFQDLKYKEFHSSLVLNSKYEIIGIRAPISKSIAKEIAKTNIEDYLNIKKGKYYEEILIEGQVISKIRDEEVFYKYFNNYIDKIDNWALCDSFSASIKIVEKYPDKYFDICINLINTNEEYKVRLGLVMILNHFINDKNIDEEDESSKINANSDSNNETSVISFRTFFSNSVESIIKKV